MKTNVMIIGAGGVAHVAAHKAAMNNDVLGDICIASRTVAKCEEIIESVRRKQHLKDPSRRLYARELNALDVPATAQLIRETQTQIVINLANAFVNMSVLEACLQTGAAYIDTAIHEEPDKVCENPPWYANYEWKRRDRCRERGVTAILGAGFDPGVVNAYAAYAKKHYFDRLDTIDIVDVNAGSHGRYFATNFDPEINFREFIKVWTWIDRQWREYPTHTVKRVHEFPVVGSQPVYLNGHDELHSLSQTMDANSVRFWMGFSNHYINVFTVLRTLGLLSHLPVRLSTGQEVVPLKVVKALLPDPKTLAPNYVGKTWIGDFVKGWKNGRRREVLLYQVSDHKKCYEEVESQAISYTAGVPPVAAAMLIAQGPWDCRTMVNVEELDPDPFLELLARLGLPTEIEELRPGSPRSFDGTVGPLEEEIARSTVTITISAANPMISVPRPPSEPPAATPAPGAPSKPKARRRRVASSKASPTARRRARARRSRR
ncbi:MAG: saccharopine dehydrogenase family protein [Kiritimatiellae bacterium]|nr:saccharopine dehydrogenase family protein [Kiritimatiellia bacterium]